MKFVNLTQKIASNKYIVMYKGVENVKKSKYFIKLKYKLTTMYYTTIKYYWEFFRSLSFNTLPVTYYKIYMYAHHIVNSVSTSHAFYSNDLMTFEKLFSFKALSPN
jgi:hypothetical protein